MDPDRVSVVYDLRRKLRKGHSEDVFNQFLTLGGFSAGAAVLLFALHLVMARLLGPESYASFGTYVAILYTAFFCLTSIHLIITRFISYHRSRYQYEQINYIITHSLRILFIAGFAAFIILLAAARGVALFFHLTGIASTVLLGFAIWFVILSPVFEGAFKGLEDFRGIGRMRLIESGIRLLAATGLVLLGFGVPGALFGLGIGTFVALMFSYRDLYRIMRLKIVKPDLTQMRRFAVPVLLTIVSISLLLNLDIILVKHFFDPAQAGVFAAASLVAKVPFFISMVFVGVMFPKITQLHADGKNATPILRNALQVVVPLVAVFTLLSFFFAGPLFSLLFGAGYVIGPTLGFYVFGMGCLSITVLLAVYLLAVREDSIAFAIPIFLVVFAALLGIFHGSLTQVMVVVMLVMVAALAYTLYKSRDFIDFDLFL